MKLVQEEIGEKTIARRSTNLIHSKFDEEIVLLSLENEEYYNLNQAGSLIWEIIAEPTSIESIVEKLKEIFDVIHPVCYNDTLSYIKELYSTGIIILTNE